MVSSKLKQLLPSVNKLNCWQTIPSPSIGSVWKINKRATMWSSPERSRTRCQSCSPLNYISQMMKFLFDRLQPSLYLFFVSLENCEMSNWIIGRCGFDDVSHTRYRWHFTIVAVNTFARRRWQISSTKVRSPKCTNKQLIHSLFKSINNCVPRE